MKYVLPVELVQPWFENADLSKTIDRKDSKNCGKGDKFYFDIDAGDHHSLRFHDKINGANASKRHEKGPTWGMLCASAHGDRRKNSCGTEFNFAIPFKEAKRLYNQQMRSPSDCSE